MAVGSKTVLVTGYVQQEWFYRAISSTLAM